MKSFCFSILFTLLSLSVFAQTPQEKGEFLTQQMNPIFAFLNLDSQKQEALLTANTQYYQIKHDFKEELLQDAEYQQALTNNFQSSAEQEILARVEAIKLQQDKNYNQAIADVVEEYGFTQFIDNKPALLQRVIDVYGE